MTIKDELRWFKQNFASDVMPALAGTPISIDLVTALAFQETGELWSKMRHHLGRDELLRLCVGDTLDTPNRSAFPKNRAALEAFNRGPEMFALAHRLLGEMANATGIQAYKNAAQRPDKFVHGYGIFQSDLQFFKSDPQYFLTEGWKDFDVCVARMMKELKGALHKLGYEAKTTFTDREASFVAIVYNTGFGNFDEDKGLEQGFFDGEHFYGENIDRYIKLARTVEAAGVAAPAPVQPAAPAAPPPSAMAAAPARESVVAIAMAEFETYSGIDEGREPLRSHVADYYEAGNGSRNLDPTKDENAWSAAFVSFCMRQSGVTSGQFAFNLSHSVYIKAAIQNELNNRGVFRGHRIGDYAPKLGDLIHHNRSGGTLNYDFASNNTGYPSHSAIVVDFETQGGTRYAITIGGNEHISGGSGTVGQKRFALLSNGKLDQSKIGPKLICVVENKTAASVSSTVMQLGQHVVNVRTDLKLRGGPGAEFPVIQALANGTRLTVLSFDQVPSGTWALVDLQNDGVKDGYVFAKFIELVG